MLFEPMFKSIVNDYKINDKILYMNIEQLRENNEDEWEQFKNKYGFAQTPELIHFNNSKNVNMVEWDTEKGLSQSRLIDWLKDNNLIQK